MDIETLYAHVCIDLQNAHFYGVSWRQMGRDTGLSPTTVRNFAKGKTRRHYFQTVVLLAEYAGSTVSIARKSNTPTLRAVK